MSDDVKFDPFIAQMAVTFARDQAMAQAQQAEHTIDNARPFPAGADVGVARDKSKVLG